MLRKSSRCLSPLPKAERFHCSSIHSLLKSPSFLFLPPPLLYFILFMYFISRRQLNGFVLLSSVCLKDRYFTVKYFFFTLLLSFLERTIISPTQKHLSFSLFSRYRADLKLVQALCLSKFQFRVGYFWYSFVIYTFGSCDSNAITLARPVLSNIIRLIISYPYQIHQNY